MSIEITLPWPPSVNAYWRTFRGRMIISAKGREYRAAVCVLVRDQGADAGLTGKLDMTIEAWQPDRRKRDLDNLLKAPLDALCHAGVYNDDSQISDLRIYWAPIIGGMLKVTIGERREN